MSESLDTIPGWFQPIDVFLFDWLLHDQSTRGVTGDLVEIGTYLGKSAVVIGAHLRDDETFTVVDLYGSPAEDADNAEENASSYGDLTRQAFESNYLRFHRELPVIVQGLSTEVTHHVRPGAVRFTHVDGSHHYRHVRADALAARSYLQAEGVVAFDDYRTAHAPGTAAAIWEQVATADLHPIVVSDTKLYATWGDAEAVRRRLVATIEEERALGFEVHELQEPLLRVFPTGAGPASLGRRVSRRLGQGVDSLARRLLD
ncbi:class I SAM-dependent methyltransferase [Geodermatophilus sp. SYSU D01119]